MEIGSAAAGISVARKLFRKNQMTMMTSSAARASVNCTSATDSRMEMERSFSTLIS